MSDHTTRKEAVDILAKFLATTGNQNATEMLGILARGLSELETEQRGLNAAVDHWRDAYHNAAAERDAHRDSEKSLRRRCARLSISIGAIRAELWNIVMRNPASLGGCAEFVSWVQVELSELASKCSAELRPSWARGIGDASQPSTKFIQEQINTPSLATAQLAQDELDAISVHLQCTKTQRNENAEQHKEILRLKAELMRVLEQRGNLQEKLSSIRHIVKE